VQAALLAVVRPGNTPHGYNLTFAFPMLMFIIIAGALFLRFRGAHNVPGHAAIRSSSFGASGQADTVKVDEATAHAPVEPEAGAAPEGTAMAGQSPGGATVEPAAGAAGEPAAGAAGDPVANGQARPADEGTEES